MRRITNGVSNFCRHWQSFGLVLDEEILKMMMYK